MPDIFARMVKQQRKVYDELAQSHAASLAKVKQEFGWSDHEVVIMGSLVEKETAAPEERRASPRCS